MKFRAQLAGLTLLTVLGCAPVWAAPASVTGLVRDSAGVPQIGAQVELLRPDLSVAASAFTDAAGRFTLVSIVPGRYSLKAMNASFLPSLRENVRVHRGRLVVNLTLNTLYEVMQWLPAHPRSSNEQSDDWLWTLRSAADRPLLRWLEDGPLVVVRDGSGGTPRLKARLTATGQAGTFGESGQRFSATVEATPQNSRALLARVDFAPNSDAGMESMLGFRQDLGYAGSVQSVAAVALHPEVEAGDGPGLEEAAVRSQETMRLGDAIEAQVGATEALARTASGTLVQGLPFADVAFSQGSSTFRYRMETMVAEPASAMTDAPMPRVSGLRGAPAFEHGLHQEFGWERVTDASGVEVLVFTDQLENPVLEAGAHLVQGGAALPAGALFDPTSGLIRAAGPAFSSSGLEASFEHTLPAEAQVRLQYANGNALAMPPLLRPAFSAMMQSAHPRRVQEYSISLSGTLEGTRTRWSASYRWQPEDTLTPVAPFAVDALAPYLSLRVCQNLHQSHDGVNGVEALIEMQNLLAQGYRPYLLSDGSILFFAQSQRALRAGLAFTF
ncbi:MAG: carboxypeptidase-like regulatory domain-containing protein [Acidobacteriota bacterium]